MRDDVTILAYTFPQRGKEDDAFSKIILSLQRTWALLGKLKTVVVASHEFPLLIDFAKREAVEVQVEPTLVPGNIKTMSMDCIKRLYRRFSTPWVLIVQDDGFPIRDNLDEFVGRADFWGAPIISDGLKRKVAYALGLGSFNGGFSLRSRKLCEHASKKWFSFFKYVFREDSQFLGEDFYYTTLLKMFPSTWLRFKFPSEKTSFAFSFDALGGKVSLPLGTIAPFGVHGRATLKLMREKGLMH